MKPVYKLFKRGKVWYSQEISSGKRKSLDTTNKREAEKLLAAMNAANGNAALQMKMAEAYLASVDPVLTSRTWQQVIDEYSMVGGDSTVERKQRVFRNPAFAELKDKKLLETSSTDLMAVMVHRTTAVIAYLKQLQNYALDMGYLFHVILPSKRFPKPAKKRQQRAITAEEHQRFIDTETNLERKAFYEMLWEIGASQTDCAELTAEDFDLERGILVFHRKKTNSICRLAFGERVRVILKRLPQRGFLFPYMMKGTWRTRAAEFGRRRRLLKIVGISLHSYRYAWAERAFAAGIPERLAMAALGHGSKTIARAYAKSAEVVCPELK